MRVSSWADLEAKVRALGVTFFNRLPSVKQCEEELQELLDEAQALTNLGEKEDGELTDDQTARWSELMDAETGLVAKAKGKLKAAKQLAAEKKRLALMRRESAEAGGFDDGTEINDSTDREREPVIRLSGAGPLQCFRGANAQRDAYNSGMWLRAILNRLAGGVDEQAEQRLSLAGISVVRNTATIGTDSAGGFLTPDPLTAAFYERRQQVGVVRPLADRRAMTANTLDIPKLVSGPSVTYPGEATAPTPSDQVWGSNKLTAVKRMVLSKISEELNDDSIINVVDQWVSRTGYEIAKQEDNEAINGDGSSTYGGETGLLVGLGNAGKLSGASTWGAMTLAHHTALMEILPSEFWGAPRWLCSAAYYHGVMLRLLAAAGGNTIAALEGGGSGPTFLGYPVSLTDRMPTATATSQVSALFGTFSDAMYLGDRMGIAFAASEDFAFDEDVMTLRATTRYDWLVHEGGDGSDAGAYVGLQTGS